jgi:hypothetical protein
LVRFYLDSVNNRKFFVRLSLHRRVPKDFFIKSLYSAKENANRAKKEFGENITLYIVQKDYLHRVEKAQFNIKSIDNYIKIPYDVETLEKSLK